MAETKAVHSGGIGSMDEEVPTRRSWGRSPVWEEGAVKPTQEVEQALEFQKQEREEN